MPNIKHGLISRKKTAYLNDGTHSSRYNQILTILLITYCNKIAYVFKFGPDKVRKGAAIVGSY